MRIECADQHQDEVMMDIVEVEPLSGRSVRLTLTGGSVIVRDLGDLLNGRVPGHQGRR